MELHLKVAFFMQVTKYFGRVRDFETKWCQSAIPKLQQPLCFHDCVAKMLKDWGWVCIDSYQNARRKELSLAFFWWLVKVDSNILGVRMGESGNILGRPLLQDIPYCRWSWTLFCAVQVPNPYKLGLSKKMTKKTDDKCENYKAIKSFAYSPLPNTPKYL